jgi:hypothetical protein
VTSTEDKNEMAQLLTNFYSLGQNKTFATLIENLTFVRYTEFKNKKWK